MKGYGRFVLVLGKGLVRTVLWAVRSTGRWPGAVGRPAAAALDLLARRHNAPNSVIGTKLTCGPASRTSAMGQTDRPEFPNSVKHVISSDGWQSYYNADPERDASMLDPEDFNSENYRICWPAILAVLAVQMILLITLSIAVANHSSFATASSTDVKAVHLKR